MVSGVGGEGGINRVEHRGPGAGNYSVGATVMDMCQIAAKLYIEYPTPRVNTQVSDGLWGILLCQ